MRMSLPNERVCSMEELVPLMREQLAAGQKVCFSPRGTSMLPMLRQGKDRVELAPLKEQPKKFDLLLYQNAHGAYVLHRVVAVGETLSCMGDNQFVVEKGICKEQIIGIVSGYSRGDKMRSVASFRHQAYCRLWHWSRPLRHFWRRGWGWLKRKRK